MSTYAEILRDWFFLLYPKTYRSYDEFEAESAIEDRLATHRLLTRMREEAPLTAQRLLGQADLALTSDSLAVLDRLVSPIAAAEWMRRSDPDDPDNEFKLTVSELAVHFGTVLIGSIGGAWRFARMPNYFQSFVTAEDYDFLVFDVLIKKCSSDFGAESIVSKLLTFISMAKSRRGDSLVH